MRYHIVTALIGLTVALGSAIVAEPPQSEWTKDMRTCLEDMDCWDCSTMGNKICGPER